MITLKKVTIKPVTVEYIPDKSNMIQDEIYISIKYKVAVHLCLCGCGELSVTPFDKGDWTFTLRPEKGLTVTPSILNTNCPNRCHYIITDNVANIV